LPLKEEGEVICEPQDENGYGGESGLCCVEGEDLLAFSKFRLIRGVEEEEEEKKEENKKKGGVPYQKCWGQGRP